MRKQQDLEARRPDHADSGRNRESIKALDSPTSNASIGGLRILLEHHWRGISALVLPVGASCYPAIEAGFVRDDKVFSEEPLIQQGSGIWRIWLWPSDLKHEGHHWPVPCQFLPDVEYVDWELPSAHSGLESPKRFLRDVVGRRVVVDEIQRLRNPSELLKIAGDYYPGTSLIATGSSSLGASRRFRDTLTERKHDLRLTPMTLPDEQEFGSLGTDHWFQHGGLPPFFLASEVPERGFQDWLGPYSAGKFRICFDWGVAGRS